MWEVWEIEKLIEQSGSEFAESVSPLAQADLSISWSWLFGCLQAKKKYKHHWSWGSGLDILPSRPRANFQRTHGRLENLASVGNRKEHHNRHPMGEKSTMKSHCKANVNAQVCIEGLMRWKGIQTPANVSTKVFMSRKKNKQGYFWWHNNIILNELNTNECRI